MLKKFISFFIPTISITKLDFFGIGELVTEKYYERQITEGDNFICGILNYSDDRGTLDYSVVEQLCEEQGTTPEEYEEDTNDFDYLTINFLNWLGY